MHIAIYSFADVDRSGKVRWTAEELGYEIEERRVRPGDHFGDYSAVNPYHQIPAVELDGKIMYESTAIAIHLAELHPDSGLIPPPGESRRLFWQDCHLTTSTLEMPVVNYFLGKRGLVDPGWPQVVGDSIRKRLATYGSNLPQQGYLLGEFTLADIFAAFCLRIAVSAELLPFEGRVRRYLENLMQRPAAQRARFFDILPARDQE